MPKSIKYPSYSDVVEALENANKVIDLLGEGIDSATALIQKVTRERDQADEALLFAQTQLSRTEARLRDARVEKQEAYTGWQNCGRKADELAKSLDDARGLIHVLRDQLELRKNQLYSVCYGGEAPSLVETITEEVLKALKENHV